MCAEQKKCGPECEDLCIAYAMAIGDPYPCGRPDDWKREMLEGRQVCSNRVAPGELASSNRDKASAYGGAQAVDGKARNDAEALGDPAKRASLHLLQGGAA